MISIEEITEKVKESLECFKRSYVRINEKCGFPLDLHINREYDNDSDQEHIILLEEFVITICKLKEKNEDEEFEVLIYFFSGTNPNSACVLILEIFRKLINYMPQCQLRIYPEDLTRNSSDDPIIKKQSNINLINFSSKLL